MRNIFYPLGDTPTKEELASIGASKIDYGTYLRVRDGLHVSIMARDAYQDRPPLKGEWYISGAIPYAYRAPNDLTIEYSIARLVMVETETVRREVR